MEEYDNIKYFKENIKAFRTFVGNNLQAWGMDKTFAINSIRYYLHCFGDGLYPDETIKEILSSGYSRMIVSALFGTRLGVVIDAKEYAKWVSERIGLAYKSTWTSEKVKRQLEI